MGCNCNKNKKITPAPAPKPSTTQQPTFRQEEIKNQKTWLKV